MVVANFHAVRGPELSSPDARTWATVVESDDKFVATGVRCHRISATAINPMANVAIQVE